MDKNFMIVPIKIIKYHPINCHPKPETHPHFSTNFVLIQTERPPLVSFQLDVMQNWQNKLASKSLHEKLSNAPI
jgi:hypothetical protein